MTGSRAWMAAVAAVMLAASALTTGTAHAAVGLLQCQGSESVTYSPSVILTPRNVTITTNGQFTSCVDTQGQVTSGSYGETFTIAAGCNNLLDPFQAERVVTWSTGDSSTLTGSGSSTAALGQVITTITGTVTAGRFQGRTVVQTITLPQTQLLLCLTTGLTGTTGLTTLTLT
ncbi:hypothetical protein [Nonomuraea endophytica]|uniref:Ig-like domain-containing protein n=1 Tax=Nonomuraea endophytica TaxID=714136 RepID=A0A7W8EM80_9ACTN|nr:hypothetical protein [Nonomuraea endophytica]MBB5084729.1 hypothetical protein [Nonomuraea endophytica]